LLPTIDTLGLIMLSSPMLTPAVEAWMKQPEPIETRAPIVSGPSEALILVNELILVPLPSLSRGLISTSALWLTSAPNRKA
jgi:hypothetical protein